MYFGRPPKKHFQGSPSRPPKTPIGATGTTRAPPSCKPRSKKNGLQLGNAALNITGKGTGKLLEPGVTASGPRADLGPPPAPGLPPAPAPPPEPCLVKLCKGKVHVEKLHWTVRGKS